MKQKQKGFTLIELLVVIAIIGLLSTLAVVSLSAARSRARDTKRLADLRSIQTALELYVSDKGAYPVFTSTAMKDLNLADGACLDGAAEKKVAFKTGTGTDTCGSPLIVLKADTLKAADFTFSYRSNSSGTKYTLWVKMENKTGTCALSEGVIEGKTREECSALIGDWTE